MQEVFGKVIDAKGNTSLSGDYYRMGEYKPTSSPTEKDSILSIPNGRFTAFY